VPKPRDAPWQEDIKAAKAAAAKVPGTADVPKVSEAARFPLLG